MRTSLLKSFALVLSLILTAHSTIVAQEEFRLSNPLRGVRYFNFSITDDSTTLEMGIGKKDVVLFSTSDNELQLQATQRVRLDESTYNIGFGKQNLLLKEQNSNSLGFSPQRAKQTNYKIYKISSNAEIPPSLANSNLNDLAIVVRTVRGKKRVYAAYTHHLRNQLKTSTARLQAVSKKRKK